MKSLADTQADVLQFAQQHGIAEKNLPTFGRSRDSGCPHIEVDDSLYHYVTVERGRELSRQSTSEYDGLLYWVFADATHSMAFAFELLHRVKGQDIRVLAFQTQLELLGRISLPMAARRAREVTEILLRFP